MTEATPPPLTLPRPLRRIAAQTLKRILNQALALDPQTRERLRTLEGKRVQLHLNGPELTLVVAVEDGQIDIQPGRDDSQLRIRATPGSLLAMAWRRMSGQGDEASIGGNVEIAGDAELARRLERLMSQYSADTEAAISERFGNVIGVPLAQALQKAREALRRHGRHGLEDSAAWLREESQLTIAPGEVEQFLDEVDLLRERSERFEARFERLRRQLQETRL
ncbi:ubiquinone biosynthesis accessory factor UbiJ [Frateuria aurantia]